VLAYALVYANLTGVLCVWMVGGLAEKVFLAKYPLLPTVCALIVVFTALCCLLAQTALSKLGLVVPQHFWPAYFQTLRLALPLATVFGLGALVHGSLRGRLQLMEQELYRKELAEERAKKLMAEARLRSLESRIHPHFLFNTLNSISALVAVNPGQAEQMVSRLAALLRVSLDNSQSPLIPLRQEFSMVESYLEIERVRFGERLRGYVDLPVELENAQVPPLSVQSLVENAVKHGIMRQNDGGEIHVTASAENGGFRIEVRDSGPGFELSAICPGHGLENLVERLDALFGAQARLNVLRRDGCSVVDMVLPRV
jgi:sensor histidine kinase YesM